MNYRRTAAKTAWISALVLLPWTGTVGLSTAGDATQHSGPSGANWRPRVYPAAHAISQSRADAPEISQSVGEDGGVIVFWPRVIPRSEDQGTRALAADLQHQLRRIVETALPGRPVDVRPEPERACPRGGCKAMTVGVAIAP